MCPRMPQVNPGLVRGYQFLGVSSFERVCQAFFRANIRGEKIYENLTRSAKSIISGHTFLCDVYANDITDSSLGLP